MAVHSFSKEDLHKSQFEKLVDALALSQPCSIGEIKIYSSSQASKIKNSFSVKMTHRKHNHGEIFEALIKIRLSETENLLGHHVDAFVQIANMEYIYKDCTYSIDQI